MRLASRPAARAGSRRAGHPVPPGARAALVRPPDGERRPKMAAPPPQPPRRGPLAYATAPVRLLGDLILALGYTAHELPYLVQDLRALVNELTRLAGGADEG